LKADIRRLLKMPEGVPHLRFSYGREVRVMGILWRLEMECGLTVSSDNASRKHVSGFETWKSVLSRPNMNKTLNAKKRATGWPKKVSHYEVSLLNLLKTVIKAKFFINFDYKISKRM